MEDVAGLYNNALESAHVIQGESSNQAPATASWSADNSLDIDLGDVDWHRYKPPTALHKAPSVTSLVLLDILAQSIENVKMRVAEEHEVKRIEDEHKRCVRQEETARNGKSLEPYLPIIIPAEPPLEPDLSSMNDMYSRADPTSTPVITASTRSSVAAAPVPRDRKDGGRRRNASRRLFLRAPESGESSSAGGAREALWQKLEARLRRVDIATTDSMTQQALLALQKSGFIAEAEPLKPVAQM
ncbi:hypothetical protein E4U53_001515 [Claviceps sorghi]|nr:hypothetical protein E4U53_001515 [Claviceps sorghi]